MELEEQLKLLKRGVDGLYSEKELKAKLASGKQLRIKLGMDPTAPDIHLGHSVVLRKMRQFQDLGHKAVLIIGDYTARIGDPTGRDTTRPILGEDDIKANAQTYLDQAGLILDLNPEKFELRYNSEWLESMSFVDILKLTGQFTVQQMLHRENFKLRMEQEKEIIVTEFLYPMMQAYDSVIVKADVELGGTDQTFNNLRGRDLMQRHEMPPQVVMVLPILVGLDGSQKMSKSKGNYVGLTEAPNDMYGKIMSIPDVLMGNYFELLTDLPEDRIKSLLNPEESHPRDSKDILAKVIVETFHDHDSAMGASDEFKRRFAEGQLPSDLEIKSVDADQETIMNLVTGVGFAGTNSEVRRLVKQGAVKWDGEKVSDPFMEVSLGDEPVVLQVGKRRVCGVKKS